MMSEQVAKIVSLAWLLQFLIPSGGSSAARCDAPRDTGSPCVAL